MTFRGIKLDLFALTLLSVSGFVFVVSAFWPGMMSVDSFGQLEQALTGKFSSHHPPLMAAIWYMATRMFSTRSAAPMLIFHNALFWGGLLAIGYALYREKMSGAWAIPLIGLIPAVWSLLPAIWKDVALTTSVVAFVGCISIFASTRRIGWAIGSLAVLFYAHCMRYNSVFAIVPCLILVCLLVCGTSTRAIQLFSLLILGFFSGNYVISHSLAGPSAERRHLAILQEFDIAGISVLADQSRFPAYFSFNKNFSLAAVKAKYDPRNADTVVLWTGGPVNDHEYQALSQSWLQAIIQYPYKYVRHRLKYAAELFDVHRNYVHYPFQMEIDGNTYDLRVAHPRFVSRAKDYLFKACHHLWYRPWFYLILSAVALIESRRIPQSPFRLIAQTCLITGIAYALPLIVIGMGADFRYSWLTVVTSVLGVFLLVSIRLTPPREPGPINPNLIGTT